MLKCKKCKFQMKWKNNTKLKEWQELKGIVNEMKKMGINLRLERNHWSQ